MGAEFAFIIGAQTGPFEIGTGWYLAGENLLGLIAIADTLKEDAAETILQMRAAKHVVDRKSVNGWRFWYIKDSSGEWVRLRDYKE